MQNTGLTQLLDSLRRLLPVPGNDLLPDSELLSRFVATRDEAAFELLVRRHGPMVYGVARRMLRDSHAADDVLQAVMLTLVRQAKSLRRKSALPAWLYRVTVRIAHKAKTNIAPEPRVVAASVEPDQAVAHAELRGIIDDAVERLPEKLRLAVILCYLGGHSCDEAARLLDCPRGTILSRLAAAREKLRDDLAARGIAIPVAAIAATLTIELQCSALTPELISLAVAVTRTAAVLSSTVLTLAQGAIAMSWTKITAATLAVFSIGIVGFGLSRSAAESQKKQMPVVKNPVADNDQAVTPSELVLKRESELELQLRQAAEKRVELKARVYEAEQKVKAIQDGIDGLNRTANGMVQAIILMREIDPVDGLGMFMASEGAAATKGIKKGTQLLFDANRRFIQAQEELKIFDEMTSIRSERLRREILTSN